MLRRRRTKQADPIVPAGLIARTEKGDFLVKGSKRFKFVSERARDSWNIHIVPTTELTMRDVKVAGIIGFRDGTLIRDISNHKIYLISDYKKLHVTDPDSLKGLGYSNKDVILVSAKEAGVHQDGGVLSA